MIITLMLSLIVVISLQNKNFSPIIITRLTSIFFLYCALLSFNVLYIDCLGSGIGIYSGLFQVTTITQSMDIFIYLIAAFVLMPWSPVPLLSSQRENTSSFASKDLLHYFSMPVLSEYSLIALFTVLGGSLLISSYDLISMYLSIELQSFAVYLLATIYRDSESATSAGLKYFLLGGLSSCFILLGSGLIYSFTGLTNFDSIYSLVSVPSLIEGVDLDGVSSFYFNQSGFILGLSFIVMGFLFKIAAAPFHNWAPDVYDDVPSIVTTWLTVMPKISIFIFILELNSGLLSESVSISLPLADTSLNVLKNLFLISSLLSLIVGTVVGLAQYKIKRLLAYSTISHVGFLLLALGVNTEQSLESLIFYLMQYSITNLNTFFIILVFGYTLNSVYNRSVSKSLDIKYISELKGQFIYNPVLSLSLAICLFSMAGIPPLLGFFAKQQILYSATSSGYYFLSIVAILVSVISASYYLQIIKVIHFPVLSDTVSSLRNIETPIRPSKEVQITNIHSMTISALTLSIILFMFNPSIILNSTHLVALSIFNY